VRLRVTAGGTPSPRQLAALTAALATVADAERAAPAEPTPPAHRSLWRRAALLELSEAPASVKDVGPAWSGER
jgi:hypothetical protein